MEQGIAARAGNFVKEAGLEAVVDFGYTIETFFAVPTGARKLHERNQAGSYARTAGGILGMVGGLAAVVLGVKEYGAPAAMYAALATNAASTAYELARFEKGYKADISADSIRFSSPWKIETHDN